MTVSVLSSRTSKLKTLGGGSTMLDDLHVRRVFIRVGDTGKVFQVRIR